jgi:glycosyltransferase involved in cell wall biosynthesis
MRLLFIADGRSPIALNWIRYFLDIGEEVHLVSTFDCAPDPRMASFTFVPVGFSQLKRRNGRTKPGAHQLPGIAISLRTRLRQWFGPLTLSKAAIQLRLIIEKLSPDLIHAMRIPYEGMLAAKAISDSQPVSRTCLLVSVWGNDFTLHAPSSYLMHRFTRMTLETANALHADCNRDIPLARIWGLAKSKPVIVLPGAGGIQSELFYPPQVPVAEPLVINPRGIRAYVNNAAFFHSIPLILNRKPDARFYCPAMAEEPVARRMVESLKLIPNVDLLPMQTRPQMAELFRRVRLAVSPSNHDGTPNTLLEAMACGCLPIAGDLESLHEWITPGVNGLLVNPNDPVELAEAILEGLSNDELQQQALSINRELIATRADYQTVMRNALNFYKQLLED